MSERRRLDVVVVGLGYVGLPLAQAAVGAGLSVAGLDSGASVVASLRAGRSHVDDLRESPALAITETLAAEHPGARILAVEPHVRALPDGLASLPNVELVPTRQALAEAQVVVLLVDHADFRSISLGDLRGRQLVDTRGIWR